ncbi:sensor histidine kinase [Chitinophaga qingshengii]|uniref:Histidine kinase n=1 Tax=Chitinophaga qingshengii TaxID=1569794 RepID=A0ABR7TL93_9BACT|nr:histidine kinase [Chitinophaga qingshengii]MBC9931265.1 histidine kinase [Chitinophaga qingshengii]
MLKRVSKYWWGQLLGWSVYFLVSLFFNFTLKKTDLSAVTIYLIIFIISGITSTHLFRTLLNKLKGWESYSFERQLVIFLVLVIGTNLVWYLGYNLLLDYMGGNRSGSGNFLMNLIERGYVTIFAVSFIWWVIYFVWHYVDRTRTSQVDRLKLEATVKELELKTIKAQMNPHFIFNALNSIRALVDENPQRARTAITELSNILRSSMATEKVETVSLENELNIVKDYLALEHIRFEERLQVRYEIDPDTLELQVPPMMLQTLVENAIKHGISRMVSGGTVFIASRLNGMEHEITIQNTGQLVEKNVVNGHGFGLESTRQRLSLLFGNRATFDIKNKDEATVEARVVMPLL